MKTANQIVSYLSHMHKNASRNLSELAALSADLEAFHSEYWTKMAIMHSAEIKFSSDQLLFAQQIGQPGENDTVESFINNIIWFVMELNATRSKTSLSSLERANFAENFMRDCQAEIGANFYFWLITN
jgi:hypothetical protein